MSDAPQPLCALRMVLQLCLFVMASAAGVSNNMTLYYSWSGAGGCQYFSSNASVAVGGGMVQVDTCEPQWGGNDYMYCEITANKSLIARYTDDAWGGDGPAVTSNCSVVALNDGKPCPTCGMCCFQPIPTPV